MIYFPDYTWLFRGGPKLSECFDNLGYCHFVLERNWASLIPVAWIAMSKVLAMFFIMKKKCLEPSEKSKMKATIKKARWTKVDTICTRNSSLAGPLTRNILKESSYNHLDAYNLLLLCIKNKMPPKKGILPPQFLDKNYI